MVYHHFSQYHTTQLAPYAPGQKPFHWCLLNALLAIWSLYIFIDAFFEKHKDAQAMYLLWSFGTTVVWLVEAILSWNTVAVNKMEWLVIIVALISTIDSLRLLIRWRLHVKHPEEKLTIEMAEVILNFVAFTISAVYYAREAYKGQEFVQEEGEAIRQEEDGYGATLTATVS